MLELRIPQRKLDDMFWIDKFESDSYSAYHVVFAAKEGGLYLASTFRYNDLLDRTEAQALDLAILFNDRYNKAVRIWECRHDEV